MSEAATAQQPKAPTSDFKEEILRTAKMVYSAQKFQIISDDEKCNLDIKDAVTHAACIRILQDRLKNSQQVYLSAVFNSEMNAAVVYINTRPIAQTTDSLCVWRATKAIMNRVEIAQSFAYSLGVMMTILGYEVYIDEATEPFSAFAKGKGEWKDDAPAA